MLEQIEIVCREKVPEENLRNNAYFHIQLDICKSIESFGKLYTKVCYPQEYRSIEAD